MRWILANINETLGHGFTRILTDQNQIYGAKKMRIRANPWPVLLFPLISLQAPQYPSPHSDAPWRGRRHSCEQACRENRTAYRSYPPARLHPVWFLLAPLRLVPVQAPQRCAADDHRPPAERGPISRVYPRLQF